MDFLSLNKDQLFELTELLEIEVQYEGRKPAKDDLIAACVAYEKKNPEKMAEGLKAIGVEITEEADEEEPKQEQEQNEPAAKDEEVAKEAPVQKTAAPIVKRHPLQEKLEAPENFQLDFRGKQIYAKNELIKLVELKMDIAGMDFTNLDLSGVVITGVSLKGCVFNKTKVDGAVFQGCDFTDAVVVNTDFDKADIRWSTGLAKLNHMGQKVD